MTVVAAVVALLVTRRVFASTGAGCDARQSIGARCPRRRRAPAALRAPRLLGNLGSYHRAIKTSNADAQKFFDEGLALLYGFNHEESFKSFELRPREGSRVADAALGHGAGARHQHQRRRAGGTIEAGLHAPGGSAAAQGRRQRSGAGSRRCAGEAIRRGSDRRSNGARAGVFGGDGRAVEEVSRRSRRRDALRREPDEPAAVAPLHEGRHAGARNRRRSSTRSKA